MASNWFLYVHPCNQNLLGRQCIPLRYGETRIGRSSLNNIRLLDERISRFHCSIFLFTDEIVLVDQSTSGTFVNQQIILDAEITLNEGDSIQLEDFAFLLIKEEAEVPIIID